MKECSDQLLTPSFKWTNKNKKGNTQKLSNVAQNRVEKIKARKI